MSGKAQAFWARADSREFTVKQESCRAQLEERRGQGERAPGRDSAGARGGCGGGAFVGPVASNAVRVLCVGLLDCRSVPSSQHVRGLSLALCLLALPRADAAGGARRWQGMGRRRRWPSNQCRRRIRSAVPSAQPAASAGPVPLRQRIPHVSGPRENPWMRRGTGKLSRMTLVGG